MGKRLAVHDHELRCGCVVRHQPHVRARFFRYVCERHRIRYFATRVFAR